jgi:hypothetical protein
MGCGRSDAVVPECWQREFGAANEEGPPQRAFLLNRRVLLQLALS